MKYFAELAYKGTNYYGWQRQPDRISVQQTLEEAFSTILREEITVTGCGRTDTGVHASQYFMHYTFGGDYPEHFLSRLNKFLPPDIAVDRIFEVASEAHARYDAFQRSYEYHINLRKNPFTEAISYYYPFPGQLDLAKMQEAARLLLQYDEFFPFCKSNTDVNTMRCQLKRAEWFFDAKKETLTFYISADRFLRGMVRLIVGMSLNVGRGQVGLPEVRQAMERQSRLDKAWSAPPQGLFLTEIHYPFVNA